MSTVVPKKIKTVPVMPNPALACHNYIVIDRMSGFVVMCCQRCGDAFAIPLQFEVGP